MPSIQTFQVKDCEDLDLLIITETVNNNPHAVVAAAVSNSGRDALARLLELGRASSSRGLYHPDEWEQRRAHHTWEAQLPLQSAAAIASRLKQQGLRIEVLQVER